MEGVCKAKLVVRREESLRTDPLPSTRVDQSRSTEGVVM